MHRASLTSRLQLYPGDPLSIFRSNNMRTFPSVSTPPLSPISPIMITRRLLPAAIRPYIPGDVLLCIFEYLSPEELLDVALVSHDFEEVALGAIRSRMRYSCRDEFIWCHPTHITLLRALCRRKCDIPRLVYTFQHSIDDATFVDEVVRLRRFLAYMRARSPDHDFCPREIVLDLCNVTSALSLSFHGRKSNEKRWAGPLAGLFDDIILFTQSLTVRCGRTPRTLQRSDISCAAKHLGLVEQRPHPVPTPLSLMGIVRSSLLHCLPRVFDYAGSRCAKGVGTQERPFPAGQDEDDEDGQTVDPPHPALTGPGPRVLNINSPLLFHPALLRWTLQLLSSRCENLDHLSFKYVDISYGCWAELFPHIQAPNLRSFHLDQSSFSTLAVAQFVARNPQIEKLRLGPNVSGSHKEDEDHRPSWLKLQKIKAIEASPSCLNRLLFGPDSSVAPELKEATVFLRIPGEENTIANLDRWLTFVHDRLAGAELTLELVMETRFVRWFQSQTIPTPPPSRTPIRHSIRHLRICADIHRLESNFWRHLPAWLAEFLPGVTSVTMVELQSECSHECGGYLMQLDVKRSSDVRALVDGLRQSCAGVTDLWVGQEGGPLSKWFKPS